MGQCQYCPRIAMTTSDACGDEESLTPPAPFPARRSSDLGLDSGHSSGDEASCGGVGGINGGGHGATVEVPGRSSHSSESSGKYSMRGSVGSLGEAERAVHLLPIRTDECLADMPVFEEPDVDEDDDDDGGVFTDSVAPVDCLQPLQDMSHVRKVSRGSSSSERGSFSSVSSVTAILKARVGRSSSLTVQPDTHEEEVLSTCSDAATCAQRTHRTVSLRLPRSHRHPDSDTNLPTIYVDDSPQQHCRGYRKSSLRRALSLLSMNTILKHEARPGAGSVSAPSSKKEQKPVQKILRQPRRRHNTVRGLSGLAIDGANQRAAAAAAAACPGLHRSHTLYYPTAATLRHATTARRAKSVAT